MQADDILRALGELRDLIQVQSRGIGGKDRALPHDLIELFENLLF